MCLYIYYYIFAELDYANAPFQRLAVNGGQAADLIFVNQQRVTKHAADINKVHCEQTGAAV